VNVSTPSYPSIKHAICHMIAMVNAIPVAIIRSLPRRLERSQAASPLLSNGTRKNPSAETARNAVINVLVGRFMSGPTFESSGGSINVNG